MKQTVQNELKWHGNDRFLGKICVIWPKFEYGALGVSGFTGDRGSWGAHFQAAEKW